ncbi:hypothetical protein DESUT3_01410 [Desulfuromonas versatilis]|uniref:Bro-N domain-containing protein n=1 Tax=Desulfuromonas versatilis TaxID=2802975 RepID=A0ABM8HR58_9BACT|nr:BRO family protein [Desulfuromonas versatilis]BCR03072.1 hypothetical protein DESUT3_01410 [Desulfuromonas versatilis]
MNIEQLTGIDMNLVEQVVHEGRRYYKAKDICGFLGMRNPSYAMRYLKPEEKIKARSNNGVRNFSMWFVSESGVYKLVLKSRSRRAARIRNLICESLLPQMTAMRTS